MKYFAGVDVGKQGAIAIIDDRSNIIEISPMPLIGKEYDVQEIIKTLTKYPLERCIVENPNMIFGVAKSAVASLNHCIGMFKGMLSALQINHILVKPKEWQKECWKNFPIQKKADGKNNPKQTSILAGTTLWSNYNFKITNKGQTSISYNDGYIDACLIAEYGRRLFVK